MRELATPAKTKSPPVTLTLTSPNPSDCKNGSMTTQSALNTEKIIVNEISRKTKLRSFNAERTIAKKLSTCGSDSETYDGGNLGRSAIDRARPMHTTVTNIFYCQNSVLVASIVC